MNLQCLCTAALVFLVTSVNSLKYYFHRQPASQTVQAGTKRVLIQCYIKNYKGTVVWTINDFAFTNFSKFPRYSIAPSNYLGEQNLQIINVTVEDNGFYNCQAPDEQLTSNYAYLNITVPPQNVSLSPFVKGAIIIKRSEDIRLNCTAISKPASTLFWKIAGAKTPATSEKVHQSGDSKLLTRSSFLYLSSESVRNGSKVECVAVHRATQTRKVVQATINIIYPPGRPTILEDLSDFYSAGEILSLTCVSQGGNPLASLTWYMGNRIIESNFFQHGKTSTSTLRYNISAADHMQRLTCAASNSATEVPLTTATKLTVFYKPKTIEVQQQPRGVRENASVSLTCLASKSHPIAHLEWLLDGKALPRLSRFSVASTNQEEVSQSTLTIANVQKADALSEYSCLVSVSALNYARKVPKMLNIFYPPTSVDIKWRHLSSSFDSQLLKAEENIELKCVAKDGNPAPVLKWYRDNVPIPEKDYEEASSCALDETCAALKIHLKPSHNQAQFKCEATSKTLTYKKSASTTLQVLFPPLSARVNVQPLRPIIGRKMNLTCATSSSNPVSKIKWLRDGKTFLIDQQLITRSNPGENGGFTHFSRIQWIPNRDDDNTDVICRVEHGLLVRGFLDKKYTLNIEYPPYFEKGPRIFNATKGGKNFDLSIPVHANPQNVTYRWLRLLTVKSKQSTSSTKQESTKKILVPNNQRVFWSRFDGTLRIGHVQQSDEGFYLVEARNTLGAATVQIHLSVLYSPVIKKVEGPGTVVEGSDVTLTCEAESHELSPTHIRWIKVGNPRKVFTPTAPSRGTSILHLKNVTSNDRGMYTCVASNGIKPDAVMDINLKIRFSARIEASKTPNKVAKPHQSHLPGTSTLPCYGAGNPKPTFQWRNENGSILIEDHLPESVISNEFEDVYRSNLTVSVIQSYDDVIRYMCVVSNNLGKDSKDILLTPRGVPDPPKDVSSSNITHNSISLTWRPGFNGGETQTFVLQYQLQKSGSVSIQKRWTSKSIAYNEHSYVIRNLRSQSIYKIKMYSLNSFGKSNETKELIIKTGNGKLPATSTSDSSDFSNYALIGAAVVGVVIVLLIVVFATYLCRKKNTFRIKRLNTETVSLPTAASSVTESDSTGTHSKNGIKFDQMSRVSYTPAEAMNERSDFADLTRHRRAEVSPSPDSTYSSLNPEERQREENGCSENISIVAYPGQRLSLSEDRRGDINAPRRVRSISGVDCKSPVPAVSYAEFMRRATSSKHQNQWEDPRDICLDQTKSECDARLRFGNDSVHSCNDKSLGNSSEQRGYHTLDRTPGKLMVALPHFKPVEEEVQHYQLPEKSFGDLKIQHQLSDAACASCDTSMCSVGFQSNLNQFPTSPFVSSHVSNPYVVSVTHANTDSSSYLQNNLYVLDANGYEGKTDSVETTPLSFANDSNHSVPHQNLQPFQRNSVASAHGPRPVDVHINSFSRQNPSISPTSSTSDGYPKLCSEGFQPIDARIVDPGYRASSTQPLLPQHNNVAHSSSLGNSSLAFQSEEGNSESKSLLPTAYSNHGQNEISSSRQNVTFLGVDKSGTLFI